MTILCNLFLETEAEEILCNSLYKANTEPILKAKTYIRKENYRTLSLSLDTKSSTRY